jgi:hypothetical protein
LVGDIAEDVTSTVQWRSSSTTLVVRPGGFATATARGEATVTASLQGMTATREVMILEPGTFRLSGTISTPGIPYSGATIEVIDGNGAGLNGTFWRSYALYGVAGPVRIRVSAEGFELVTRDVTVLGHTVVDLDLRPTTEASLIAGVYSLTMSASPACSERLPEWLRQRSFDVIVTVESSEFRVRFMSSTLDETHGEWIFPASLWNERLKLDLPYGRPFVDGMLLEDLRAAKYFALSGTITATAAKTELRGAFDGRFALYDGSSPGRLQETAACQDSAHEAVFRRQPGR